MQVFHGTDGHRSCAVVPSNYFTRLDGTTRSTDWRSYQRLLLRLHPLHVRNVQTGKASEAGTRNYASIWTRKYAAICLNPTQYAYNFIFLFQIKQAFESWFLNAFREKKVTSLTSSLIIYNQKNWLISKSKLL